MTEVQFDYYLRWLAALTMTAGLVFGVVAVIWNALEEILLSRKKPRT